MCCGLCSLKLLFLLDTRPSEKATKTKYIYRSSKEIYEEVTKNGVHKMAREYRLVFSIIIGQILWPNL